ncbi:MAG: ATP-binding protein [Chloroflexota bacterium]
MKKHQTLYLITGHTGAGKSTIAKKMAADLPAFYLSHDELLVKAYGDNIGHLDFQVCCKRMDQVIWKQAQQLFDLEIDLVLEGYGTRAMRDDVREQAQKIGYTFRLIWIECPADIRFERVRQRNKNLNDEGYAFTDEEFWEAEQSSEGLDPDEIADWIDNSATI